MHTRRSLLKTLHIILRCPRMVCAQSQSSSLRCEQVLVACLSSLGTQGLRNKVEQVQHRALAPGPVNDTSAQPNNRSAPTNETERAIWMKHLTSAEGQGCGHVRLL